MKINIAYITSFLLILSLSNSYSATFDYDYINVNSRVITNSGSMSFANNDKMLAISHPYYYLTARTDGFYLSQYNYLLNQAGWATNWARPPVGGTSFNVIITPDSSRLLMSGTINVNYDGQTNNGLSNTYLAWVNATNGTVEQSRIFGSTNTDTPANIALDSHTNIFVLVTTDGYMDTNTNKGALDICLTKYSYDGTRQWSKMWGTTTNDIGRDVKVDGSNNVYLLGDTFGNMGGTATTNSGLCDMFLIKTDNDGNTLWTKMIGAASNDFASSIGFDSSNNIIVLGYTNASFYPAWCTEMGHIELLKIDSANGNTLWAKAVSTNSFYHESSEILTDKRDGMVIDRDNIYISGTVAHGTSSDSTLMKLTNNGSNIWTKTWTNYTTLALYKDTLGNIIICQEVPSNNFEIKTLFPKYDLIIDGSPSQYGTNSLPFYYGTNRVTGNITWTNSISDIYPSNGTRHVCNGWNGTGSIAPNGFTNIVSFCLTNDSTLTWNWQKQYWVSVSNTAGCSVNYIRGTNGWNNEGTELILSAYPQVYFKYWQIEPIHASPTDNPKSLPPLTQSLSIVANFGWEDNGYGIAWEWKVLYWGTDIGSWNPTTNSDCNVDGFTDYEAYLAGINPTNGNIFAITSVSLSNGLPVISWKNDYTDYGRYFTIMAKDELMSTSWSILGSVFAAGNGSYTDTNAHSHAFYKVVVGIK